MPSKRGVDLMDTGTDLASVYRALAGDDYGEKLDAHRYLVARRGREHRLRNAWRAACLEAVREGRAVWVLGSRAQYRPWDGRHGALGLACVWRR